MVAQRNVDGRRETKSLAVGLSGRVAVTTLPWTVTLIVAVLASFDGAGDTGALSLHPP